jgi:4-carboxymuconolactone decarboxylase
MKGCMQQMWRSQGASRYVRRTITKCNLTPFGKLRGMRALAMGLLAVGWLALGGLGAGKGQTAGDASAALPKDIDSQSYSRLPLIKRDDLKTDEDKRIYDMLAGGEGKTVTPTGPAAISLYSPKAAEAIQMLNQYLRFHGVLKARDFEVAILVTAREFDQPYEWSGHEMGARNAKVPDEVIDVIKYNRDALRLSDRDTLLITFARDSLRQHRIGPDVWARTVEMFGQQGALELATIIGDYAMAAVMLNATDQHLPPGRQSTLPAK